jgi:four helix bundle protein
METLIIYKKALELVKKIYILINNNPKLRTDFSLNDQLKRAAVSVATNIAEGYCRSKKSFNNYLQISSGSTNEMVTLLKIVNLVYEVNTADLQEEYRYLGKQIISFSKTL